MRTRKVFALISLVCVGLNILGCQNANEGPGNDAAGQFGNPDKTSNPNNPSEGIEDLEGEVIFYPVLGKHLAGTATFSPLTKTGLEDRQIPIYSTATPIRLIAKEDSPLSLSHAYRIALKKENRLTTDLKEIKIRFRCSTVTGFTEIVNKIDFLARTNAIEFKIHNPDVKCDDGEIDMFVALKTDKNVAAVLKQRIEKSESKREDGNEGFDCYRVNALLGRYGNHYDISWQEPELPLGPSPSPAERQLKLCENRNLATKCTAQDWYRISNFHDCLGTDFHMDQKSFDEKAKACASNKEAFRLRPPMTAQCLGEMRTLGLFQVIKSLDLEQWSQ